MNPRHLAIRMRSIRKTSQITRAMQMVAAVKFRRTQAALLAARPYAGRLREVAARAADWGAHPLLQARPVRRRLLLAVAGDKGLCGSFNHNLARAARCAAQDPPAADVWLLGRKLAAPPGGRVFRQAPQAGADPAAIAAELECLFRTGQYDRIELCYARFHSARQHELAQETLLPLALPAAGRAAEPLLEPDAGALLDALLPRCLAARLRLALLETAAAEHGTRMTMMDQATRNANDLLARLGLAYNKARQWGITRELTDITTGVEAMG